MLNRRKLEILNMARDKQIQKAGSGSQQIQAGPINYYVGVEEKRVREVCAEMIERAKEDWALEAQTTMINRNQSYANILIPRIEKIEKDFNSFSDPSFLRLLRKSQITAACTDRNADYEMLSELLVHRIENKSDQKVKASIERAVEIIDQIDDEALCGLTLIHAIHQFSPTTGSIHEGIQVLANLYAHLMYQTLPVGDDWTSHLDILDTIRVSQLGGFKKLKDIFANSLDGYTCTGLEIDSESYPKAIEILNKANLTTDILVEHELCNSHVRLALPKKSSISQLVITSASGSTSPEQRSINENEIAALNDIWALYNTDPTEKQKIIDAFNEKWDSFDILRRVEDWWDHIPYSFSITPIGKVLAHANAQRYDRGIPNIKF